MAWFRTSNVLNLERQLDERFPNRDHTSDGTIGDTAHQGETSGHNPDDTPGSKPAWDGDPDNIPEVRAKDVDSDLRESGVTMQDVVNHLIALPHLEIVCRYLIYNRFIYHSPTWVKLPYPGNSPHTEHLHYEGAWNQAADDNGSFDFKLWEIGMAQVDLTPAAVQAIANKLALDLAPQNHGSSLAKGVRENVEVVIDDRLVVVENSLHDIMNKPQAVIDPVTLKNAVIEILHEIVAGLPNA